ncbi:MAG: hypothetical protein WD556_11270 [Actinomycetota bacterium]
MTAIASDDVWVIGKAYDAVADENFLLISHWDGGTWTDHSPMFGRRQPFLYDIDAVASDDVWLVGGMRRDGKYRAFSMHWDGTEWTDVAVPSPDDHTRNLSSVAAIAEDDVWAVGTRVYRQGEEIRNLAVHWNGKAWSTVPTPDLDGRFEGLDAVDGMGTNVWAVGNARNHNESLALRWRDGRWRHVPTPQSAAGDNYLTDVSIVSGKQVWASGSIGVASIIRWTGTSWRRADEPIDGASGWINSIDTLPDGSGWAAGYRWTTNFKSKPLLIQRDCA